MSAPSDRVTIRDVARHAGVSTGAVSIVFNDKPGVSPATRERILEAARELGWTPNSRARSLSGTRVDTVGLAICRPARLLGLEPFYMEFISGIESVLTDRSCSLLLRLVRDLDEEIGLYKQWWQGRQVGGSIVVDFHENDPRVSALENLGMPTVAVGHPSLTGALTSVWTDDATAVAEAVRYLAALGHRRIARVGARPAWDTARSARQRSTRWHVSSDSRRARRWPPASRARTAPAPPARCSSLPTGPRPSSTTTTSWRWRARPWRRSSGSPSRATCHCWRGTTRSCAV